MGIMEILPLGFAAFLILAFFRGFWRTFKKVLKIIAFSTGFSLIAAVVLMGIIGVLAEMGINL